MLLNRAKDSVDVLVVVRDIEKSLEFYQRTLGLEKRRSCSGRRMGDRSGKPRRQRL